jgi:predicted ATPase
MVQQPFLKSIRPVNLLSFGPKTKEIELRPLNILIGPNGCGKSNFIEILGLLKDLPGKDPWSVVLETGGVDEWVWKGPIQAVSGSLPSAIAVTFYPLEAGQPLNYYEVRFAKHVPTYTFNVLSEALGQIDSATNRREPFFVNRTQNSPDSAYVRSQVSSYVVSKASQLDLRLSLLAQLVDVFNYPELYYFEQKLSRIALYRDWIFGLNAEPRDPQPVGLDSTHLEEDTRNLAQVLKAIRDRGEQATFNQLVDLLRKFYEPAKDVDVELVGTHLRIMIKEEGLSSRTPATRLSDGTLRWLALLTILLNPTPAPVTCIEEPELGLHPDILPTLADLLRDASTRTQLILTTHSRTLVECFSDAPESICVCEKFDGATEIRRLEADRLKVWLEKYSLGQLWSSGEIGGNRW